MRRSDGAEGKEEVEEAAAEVDEGDDGEEEAKEWIQKLQFVKERVIKERMGHSSVASSDKLTNSVAAKQVQEAVLQKEIESHTQNMGALYAGVLA